MCDSVGPSLFPHRGTRAIDNVSFTPAPKLDIMLFCSKCYDVVQANAKSLQSQTGDSQDMHAHLDIWVSLYRPATLSPMLIVL